MSYYSDVGICVNKKYVAKFEKDVAERSAAKNVENLLSHDHTDEQGTHKGHKLWVWDCFKWYEDSPDVAAVVGAMRELEAGDTGDDDKNFLYIEVGEQEDHNVIHGNWYDNPFNLGLVRRLGYTVEVQKGSPDEELVSEHERGDNNEQ
jgi:hypothetical protein